MHMDFELWHQKINSPLSPMLQWPHFCHYLIPLSLAGRLKSFSTHKRWQKGRDCNFQRILASECHYGRLNRWTHSNRRVQPKSRGEKTLNGVCGLCSAYIGFLHASLACLLVPKVLALKSSWTTVHIFKVVQCTAMACNLVFTLRTKPGWCACGSSPTRASTRVCTGVVGYLGRDRGRVGTRSMENLQRAEFSLLPHHNSRRVPISFPHIFNISVDLTMF